MDTGKLATKERGLEEGLGATETLVTNGDDLTVGKLVALLEGGGGGSSLHLGIEVEGDVAELLLDVTNDFTLSSGGEGITTLGEDLHEVVSKIATGKIETEDGMGESITLIDGDSVGNTISNVEDDTSGTTRGIEGEHSLDGDIHGGAVEGLEHDLGHLLTVGLGVKGGLSEEDGVLLGGNAELVVEGVVPDLLHVVPVGHNTVLNGVLEGEDTTLGLSLISDIGVLLTHADHHTFVAGATNNGGEDSAGSVVTGKASLAHAGTVVNNESLNFVVSHER
jgi:hypothetical protein